MIYVLDDRLNPVPTEIPGELYIAGLGLSRGYLNRPDLTAERFLPNPFSQKGGDRFYKTGDLGRWRKNGSLEFLGRIDQQVKIRGHRIEPGEIEAALRRFQGIADVAVVPWVDQLGVTKLLAYVVGHTGEGLSISEVKEHLRGILPEYMIPSRYIKIKQLPMTPGGKLDRAALPAPGSSTDHETYVEPRSDTEKILCRIYARVLNLERVGIEDNFFEIGGDSIQGLQLVSEAEASGVQFTIQDIFQFQTVAALAARVSHSPVQTAALAADMPLQQV
jgi:acyl carrier protein